MHSNYLELCVLTCVIHSNLGYLAIRRVSLHLIHLLQPFRLNDYGAQSLQ